jgi:hypothetical protein
MEGQGLISSSGRLKIEPSQFDKKYALKRNFDFKSNENFEEFIKNRVKEELGLIDNRNKI